MCAWLASGLRRDLCIAVAGLDAPTDRELKREIELRRDERIRPKTFYGAIDALEKDGYLEREIEGVHDRFSLTSAGDAALREQYEWFSGHLGADE